MLDDYRLLVVLYLKCLENKNRDKISFSNFFNFVGRSANRPSALPFAMHAVFMIAHIGWFCSCHILRVSISGQRATKDSDNADVTDVPPGSLFIEPQQE